jgi:hypothetical protein
MSLDKIVKTRSWNHRFSFLKRNCYISGESLRFQWAYRGRRHIWYPVLSGGNVLYDDIWLSSKEYLTLLSKGKV